MERETVASVPTLPRPDFRARQLAMLQRLLHDLQRRDDWENAARVRAILNRVAAQPS